MSEPSPEKTEAPVPVAPALGELFELSLTALANAPGAFARLAARPAPGPGASLALALAWGAAFFALNLLHIAIANPAVLRSFASWQIAAVAFFALGAWTALFLLGASALYGLVRALGSKGDFDRALLLAAITLTAAPVHSLCRWVPMAWIVPALLAAWMLACGLTALFQTAPALSRGVCALLAAVVLAFQYGAGLAVDKFSTTARFAAAAAQNAPPEEQLVDLQQQLQQVQALAAQTPTEGAPAQSSLDLLRGPESDQAPEAPPTDLQKINQINAMGDALNKSSLAMLDSMAPMLDNPLITKNMTLQQKSDYAELKRMMAELRAGLAANTITSAEEQQAKMQKIQALAMRMMSGAMRMPAPQAPPPGGERE